MAFSLLDFRHGVEIGPFGNIRVSPALLLVAQLGINDLLGDCTVFRCFFQQFFVGIVHGLEDVFRELFDLYVGEVLLDVGPGLGVFMLVKKRVSGTLPFQ